MSEMEAPKWLKAEEVTEPGWYWWRPETITPMTRTKLDVYRVKKSVNAKYISTLIAKPYEQLQEVQFIGGLWQRIPEPTVPTENA